MLPSEPCSCELAGYCERHHVRKTEHWHRLCQARTDYREVWDRGIGPGQDNPHFRQEREQLRRDTLQQQRELWRELHSYRPDHWDAEVAERWFKAWLAKVPTYGCACNEHFRSLIAEPGKEPDFSSQAAFFRWGVDRHNDVNERLGKPIWKPSTCAVCNKPATRICSYTLSLGMCGYPLCDDCTHAHTL